MEPRRLVRYYGAEGRGAHLPFNFALVTLPWDARTIGAAVAAYEAALPANAWPNWVLGNHDQSRVATPPRAGAGAGRGDAAAHAPRHADALLRRRAGPARRDGAAGPDRRRRRAGSGALADAVDACRPARRVLGRRSRGCRWSTTPAAWSVEAQRADPASMLALHRRLLALRRASPALHRGAWTAIAPAAGWPGGPRRVSTGPHGDERVRVLLNLTAATRSTVPLPGAWTVAVGHGRRRARAPRCATASRSRGDEGLVLRAGLTAD